MCNLILHKMVTNVLEQPTATLFKTEDFIQNEVVGPSETLMSTSQTIQYHISEYSNFNIYNYEILKSVMMYNVNC